MSSRERACENHRKVSAAAWALLVLALAALPPVLPLTVIAPVSAAQPNPEAAPVEHAAPAGEAHPEGEAHAEAGWLPTVARVFNAAILAGTLVYFLRAPLAQYLGGRSASVRQDLVTAAATREAAHRQLQEIDERLAALPGELAALRARGAQEIAAEQARIQEAANADRNRVLEQTRREIDLQVRVAQRELIAQASQLAVGVAGERIRRNITDADQIRLVDRYVEQVKADA
jgi:F0F1-type ATP synthase membrane subunit b/b'